MRVDVARAEVDVLTPKGRQQTVPIDWIEAVRNASHTSGSKVAVAVGGNRTVSGRNATRVGWLDDAKFKELLHRRRAKARVGQQS